MRAMLSNWLPYILYRQASGILRSVLSLGEQVWAISSGNFYLSIYLFIYLIFIGL